MRLLLADVDDCSPNPCEHGGSCTDGVNSYDCDCVTGYTGSNCQTGTECIQLVLQDNSGGYLTYISHIQYLLFPSSKQLNIFKTLDTIISSKNNITNNNISTVKLGLI